MVQANMYAQCIDLHCNADIGIDSDIGPAIDSENETDGEHLDF